MIKQRSPLTLIAAFIFMGVAFVAKSQMRYEYAVVDYQPWERVLKLSINVELYKEAIIDKNEVKGQGDVNPALKEIRSMTDVGWEVFQVTTLPVGTTMMREHVFYLRKRIE